MVHYICTYDDEYTATYIYRLSTAEENIPEQKTQCRRPTDCCTRSTASRGHPTLSLMHLSRSQDSRMRVLLSTPAIGLNGASSHAIYYYVNGPGGKLRMSQGPRAVAWKSTNRWAAKGKAACGLPQTDLMEPNNETKPSGKHGSTPPHKQAHGFSGPHMCPSTSTGMPQLKGCRW